MADPYAPLVLFIDDDPATRDLAERMLASFGWRVTALASPEMGADEIAAMAPDAVVLDYWFGREPLAVPFLERLRANPATARLPVLLVSAATVAVAQDRERIEGLVDGVLFKPYGLGELRGAIERCLALAPASD